MADVVKYRIMVVAAKKDKNNSLYKYLLDGDKPYEAITLDEIDAKIEKMLNVEGYAKSDFIVVNELEFNVFANVVSNTELRPDIQENPDDGENSGGNSGDPSDPVDPNNPGVPTDPEPTYPEPSDPNPSDPEPEPEPSDPSDPGQNDPDPDPDTGDPDPSDP